MTTADRGYLLRNPVPLAACRADEPPEVDPGCVHFVRVPGVG